MWTMTRAADADQMVMVQRVLDVVDVFPAQVAARPLPEETTYVAFGPGSKLVDAQLKFNRTFIEKTAEHMILGMHLRSPGPDDPDKTNVWDPEAGSIRRRESRQACRRSRGTAGRDDSRGHPRLQGRLWRAQAELLRWVSDRSAAIPEQIPLRVEAAITPNKPLPRRMNAAQHPERRMECADNDREEAADSSKGTCCNYIDAAYLTGRAETAQHHQKQRRKY